MAADKPQLCMNLGPQGHKQNREACMTGIIDYARTELRPFSELPFNEIDALIIATLIYEDVANICPTLMLG